MTLRAQTLALGLALLIGFGAATAAPAQTTVILTADALNGLGTFYIDFQLLDGAGIGDGNSKVVLSDLSLIGGSLSAALPVTGNATGDPTTGGGLTLIDSDPGGVAEYQQAFTVNSPTSELRFTINLTGTPPADDPFPDIFNFLLLQSDGLTPLPTDGPTEVEFVTGTIPIPAPSAGPPLTSYGTAPGSPVTLPAPLLLPSGSAATPEPSTLALLAFGAITLTGVIRRKEK